MVAIAIAGSAAALACAPAKPPARDAEMPTSNSQQQIPYDVTPRVWRDEQPGDEPRLVVSATFVPRDPSTRWQDVRLRSLELQAEDRRWTPSESTVSPSGDGGFEVKAFGDATLPAGAGATIIVTLQTSSGEKRVELTTKILSVR